MQGVAMERVLCRMRAAVATCCGFQGVPRGAPRRFVSHEGHLNRPDFRGGQLVEVRPPPWCSDWLAASSRLPQLLPEGYSPGVPSSGDG